MKKQDTRQAVSFEWHSLFKDIIRNLWLILLAGIIAWMGVYVAEKSLHTPLYTSSATLVVRSRVGSSGQYNSFSVTSEMAKIFTEVFCQPSMKRLAAENLGKSSFDGSISASVINSTNLMRISVSAGDPASAYSLLSSVLEVYPNISESVFSNAVIDILSYPNMPTYPSNSVPAQRRTMFVMLAMAAETFAIVLLSLLRDTVKNEQHFHSKIDGKLLGTVVHEKPHLSLSERLRGIKRSILGGSVYSSLRFTEDYQKLAQKLEYARENDQCTVFTVTSIAENEGKSTAAVNLALALISRGARVALLDFDTRKPAIHKILECPVEKGTALSDVLSGKRGTEQLKLLRYRRSELYLGLNSASSRSNSQDWLKSIRTTGLLARIRTVADYVIIDTPPVSVSADAVYLSSLSDRTIVIVRTDKVAASDINDTLLTLESSGGEVMGCILNDVYAPFTLFGQIGSDEYGYYDYYSRSGYAYRESGGDADCGELPPDRFSDLHIDPDYPNRS